MRKSELPCLGLGERVEGVMDPARGPVSSSGHMEAQHAITAFIPGVSWASLSARHPVCVYPT